MDDSIVPIPPERVKFFGGTGRMLLPSPKSVAAVIDGLPEGTEVTVALLRKHLAEAFGVEAVCPPTTRKAWRALSEKT